MAILEQITEPELGKPGWNPRFKQILDRVNLMPEIVLDVLAQKLVGVGLTVSYNSATKVLTLTNSGSSGLDSEALMDYLAANLTINGNAGNYDDPAGSINFSIVEGSGTSPAVVPVPRVVALTDDITITPNADTTDIGTVTLAGNRNFAPPGGTLVPGQKLLLRIKQDATGSRLPTWNAIYRFPGGAAPTLTTTAGKTDYIGFIYNQADTKWDCVAVTKNL